jgi:hypothetical protein
MVSVPQRSDFVVVTVTSKQKDMIAAPVITVAPTTTLPIVTVPVSLPIITSLSVVSASIAAPAPSSTIGAAAAPPAMVVPSNFHQQSGHRVIFSSLFLTEDGVSSISPVLSRQPSSV